MTTWLLVLVLLAGAGLVAPGRVAPLALPHRRAAPAGDHETRTRPGRAPSTSPTTVTGPRADHAGPTTADVGECARLLACALHAGVGIVEAVDVVARFGPPAATSDLRRVVAAQRWGMAAETAWQDVGPAWATVAQALAAADDAGLSPVRALEGAAVRLDDEHRARVATAVRRVEVLVVLPLGLAFLPGFLLTTVVPVVVALSARLVVP